MRSCAARASTTRRRRHLALTVRAPCRCADDPALGTTLSQPVVDAVAAVVEAGGYDYVLAAASVLASDVAAALAARLDLGIVVDVLELHAEGGRLVTRRPGLGDSVLAHCALHRRSRRRRRARQYVRAGVVGRRGGDGRAPGRERAGLVAARRSSSGTRRPSAAASTSPRPTCSWPAAAGSARPEASPSASELAKALGGEVAATRAVVDCRLVSRTARRSGRRARP